MILCLFGQPHEERIAGLKTQLAVLCYVICFGLGHFSLLVTQRQKRFFSELKPSPANRAGGSKRYLLCFLCHTLSLLSRCFLRYIVCTLWLFPCAGMQFFLFIFYLPLLWAHHLFIKSHSPLCVAFMLHWTGTLHFTTVAWIIAFWESIFRTFAICILLLLVLLDYYKRVAFLSFHVIPVHFKLKGLLSLVRLTSF